MTVSQRLAAALLKVAAERWPRQLRDTAHQEWTAELHALIDDPSRRPLAELRFAASLALARPPRPDGSEVPGHLVGFGAMAVAIAAPSALSLLYAVLLPRLMVLLIDLAGRVRDTLPAQVQQSWLAPVARILLILMILVGLAPIVAVGGSYLGRVVARWLGPAVPDARARTRRLAPLVVGLALVLPVVLELGERFGLTDDAFATTGAIVGVLIAAPLLTRLAARSRLSMVVAVVLVAALATAIAGWVTPDNPLEVKAYTAPLWLPYALTYPAPVLLPFPLPGPAGDTMQEWLGLLPQVTLVLAAFTVSALRWSAAPLTSAGPVTRTAA